MYLVDCFVPFMAAVRHFQEHPVGDVTSASESFVRQLEDALRQTKSSGVDDKDAMEALFAVVSWADEVLLASAWTGAQEWKNLLLQRRYFNVSNAGVAFFTRLEGLGPAQGSVREVYCLCLSMGFTGRYGHGGNMNTLAEIKQAGLRQVTAEEEVVYGNEWRQIFPDAYPKDDLPKKIGRLGRWRPRPLMASVVLIPLVVLVILFGTYHLILSQTINGILEKLQ